MSHWEAVAAVQAENISAKCVHRFSARKRTSSCTHKFTCAKLNRTSARSAPRRSQTLPTCRNTHASTWASSRTAARFANANSHNYPICSNTSAPTPATSPTSADIPAARKLSHNCPICSRTRVATKRTNPSNVIHAISVSRMSPHCSIIYPSTRSLST